MLPSRIQWKKWSLPTKLGVISAYLGIAGFLLAFVFYFFPYSPSTETSLPILPGGSGWLLVGDFDEIEDKYTRGPFFEIISSNYNIKSAFPRKGDIIRITADRNLVISDYKVSGINKLYQPPWQENYLKDDDFTGIKILPGSQVEVRDVSMGHFPYMPFVVWVRIGYPPKK
jgi:hypothetical protein